MSADTAAGPDTRVTGAKPAPPKPAPMPPNPSLLKRLSHGRKSSLALVQEAAFGLGGVGRHVIPQAPSGKKTWLYTVREPELIREVLVGRAGDFPKSRLMRSMLSDLIGDSVFVANGETWRWRRAILDQALEQARVRDVMDQMRAAAEALVGRIEAQLGQAGEAVVRIDIEATHFAADVIFRTLFSEPIADEDAARIVRAFERYQGLAYAHGMLRLARLPVDLFPGAIRRRSSARAIRSVLEKPLRRRLDALELFPVLKNREKLRRFFAGALPHRQTGPTLAGSAPAAGRDAPSNDILASLIACADPQTGRRFGPEELLDEAAMLFLAGHETSASALGWAVYLLAIAPEAQHQVHAEALAVLGERQATFADMKALAFTRNVFREALRLYPPVAQISRDTTGPEQMCDRDVEPGAVVFCPPWILHRQPRFWADPDAFDPDRFETEAGREAARCAYFPFSMGPRVCPGAAFALQEATLALAMLVRRFAFTPVEGRVPTPVGRLTLRSGDGVALDVRRRPGAGEIATR